MGRANKGDRLTRVIGVRVSERFYNRLEGLRENTNCQTPGEFARMILQREEIIWYHKDASQEVVAVELTAIRRELNSIGININQITRYFNSSALPSQKIYEALNLLDEYKKIQAKIDSLYDAIDKLKWSPK